MKAAPLDPLNVLATFWIVALTFTEMEMYLDLLTVFFFLSLIKGVPLDPQNALATFLFVSYNFY